MTDVAENPVIESGQFFGEDGTFADNWQEQAYGAEDPMRSNETLRNTKSVRSMASQLVNGQKHIGELTGGREFAILPNEHSDETEMNDYYTKTGRPETAADYKLGEMQLPEGLPADEKLATAMGDIFHKAGMSSKMAAEVHNGYAQILSDQIKEQKTQEALDDAAANTELRGKLGAAYDKTMRDINVVVNALGNDINPEETAALLAELPNDVFATQLLAKVAAKLVETPLGEVAANATGEITPADAMAQANKIMNEDPYYLTARPEGKPANKAYHDKLVSDVAKLFNIASKGGA